MPIAEFDEVSLILHTHKKYKVLLAFTFLIWWTQAHSYMTLRGDSHTMSTKKGLLQPHSASFIFWYFEVACFMCSQEHKKNFHIFKEKSGRKEQDSVAFCLNSLQIWDIFYSKADIFWFTLTLDRNNTGNQPLGLQVDVTQAKAFVSFADGRGRIV